MPEVIAIGCDVSKGRIDVVIRNHAGTRLAGSDAYDDTRSGHERLRRVIDDLHERYPNESILVGLETTGGMERNWLAFFRGERRWVKTLRIHHINALSLARYRQATLHRAPGDVAAAEAIVVYLQECCVRRKASTVADHGPIGFYRSIRSLIIDQIRNRQRLQAMLTFANPEVIQYTRSGIPDWLYVVLERYPTALQLSRAREATIESIPHMKVGRAAAMIAEAKASVASQTDPATAETIRMLIGSIRDYDRRIEDGKKGLYEILQADPNTPTAQAVRLLESMPNIGSWTAIIIACEIGDISRFSGHRSLIAWAGLDPVIEASGDDVVNRGISHRGNAHVRAMLFMVAMSAVKSDSPFATVFHRLVERGKPRLAAMVAVMTKILRVAYAILVTGKPFDAEYAIRTAKPQADATQIARSAPAADVATVDSCKDIRAPVSRLEAKRRKAKNATIDVPPKRGRNPNGITGGPPPQVARTHPSAKG